jgi:LysM repeat protein
MVAVPVVAGDTLSGIAAAHGVSLSAVESANPSISNPNYIVVGENVIVPSGNSWTPSSAPVQAYQAPAAPTYNSSPSSVYVAPAASSSGSGGFSIPGMPSSLANCIAYRESTDDTNPAADGNAFGIIPASGYNVAGDSLAQQEQVAGQIYATTGGSAWSADGCPGT